MRPRLLSKSEIAAKQALDRKREIDEGLKIAKHIDVLRETHAEEETSLQRFREKIVSEIHQEITEANDELQALKLEIKDLKEELEILKGEKLEIINNQQ